MKRLEHGLGLVAAASLFAMMLLTFVDVFSRKFLNTAITGSVELTELLMFVLIFVGLPLVSLRGEHVLFDLLDHFLPAGFRKMQNAIAHLINATLVGGAGVLVWQRAMRSAEQGDMTAQLEIGFASFQYMAAIALGIAALIHLVLATRRPTQGDGLEGGGSV